jgi:hypothetical protein
VKEAKVSSENTWDYIFPWCAAHLRGDARCLLLLALVAVACVPDLEQIQGEHLLYEHSANLHLCAGTVEWMDQMVPFLEEQLQVTAPAARYSWIGFDKRIDYRLDVQGATIGGHVYGQTPDLTHEMVHLVATAGSARFFEEGLAMAHDFLGGPDGGRYPSPEGLDPRPTMTASVSREVDYRAAGLFVAFLLVRHGPERLRNLRRSILWPHSRDHIEDVFRNAYGRELDAEVDDFMRGEWECPPDHFDLQVVECGSPTVQWETPSWLFSGVLDCESGDVVGGYSAEYAWPSSRAVTLDIPVSGRYELRIAGSPEIKVRFGQCFGCLWEIADQVLEPGEHRSLDLKAGRYYVRVSGMSDAMPDFSVTLMPQ